jgi:hypothetical protein
MLAPPFARELVKVKRKLMPIQGDEQIRHNHALFNDKL